MEDMQRQLQGDSDQQESPEPPPLTTRVAKQLLKTRFCKHFFRGYCRYQDKCTYAHGAEELMPRPNLAKTKICVGFLTGTCHNNEDCAYAHGLTEIRKDENRGLTAGDTSEEPLLQSMASCHSGPQASASSEAASSSQRQSGVSVSMLLTQAQESRLCLLGEPAVADSDHQLLHEALSVIMQLLVEEESVEVHGSVFPTAHEQHWEGFVQRALRKRRREILMEGHCLLVTEKKEELSFQEEQLATYFFLRRPGWAEIFPKLVDKCSRLIASRLGSALPSARDWGISSPVSNASPRVEHQNVASSKSSESNLQRKRHDQETAGPYMEVPYPQYFSRSLDLLPDLESDSPRQCLPGTQALVPRSCALTRGPLYTRSLDSLPAPCGWELEDPVMSMAHDWKSLQLLTVHLDNAA